MRNGFWSAVPLAVITAGLAWGQSGPVLPPANPYPPVPGADPIAVGNYPNFQQAGASPAADAWNNVYNPAPTGTCEQCPPTRVWVSGEYIYWWVHKKLPPLITANSSTPGTKIIGDFVIPTPPNTPTSGGNAALGQPDTQFLFGGAGGNDHEQGHSGGRLTAGFWLENLPIGFEARYTFLTDATQSFKAVSDANGGPVLGRPVIDALNGQETVETVSSPALFSGGVGARSTTSWDDAQANMLIQTTVEQAYLVLGFRYMTLDEDLAVVQSSNVLSGGLIGNNGQFFGPSSLVSIGDGFITRNQFYGGQIGLRVQGESGPLFMNVLGNVGIGVTHQSVTAQGSTVLTPAGGTPVAFPGGLLALPTNSGHFTHDTISVVPDIGINFGIHLCANIDVFAGYSFLYWSDVRRPDGIDRVINPTQLPTSELSGSGLTGPARPSIPRETDFWTQGVNFGVALRF